jgi:hypothetical protein
MRQVMEDFWWVPPRRPDAAWWQALATDPFAKGLRAWALADRAAHRWSADVEDALIRTLLAARDQVKASDPRALEVALCRHLLLELGTLPTRALPAFRTDPERRPAALDTRTLHAIAEEAAALRGPVAAALGAGVLAVAPLVRGLVPGGDGSHRKGAPAAEEEASPEDLLALDLQVREQILACLAIPQHHRRAAAAEWAAIGEALARAAETHVAWPLQALGDPPASWDDLHCRLGDHLGRRGVAVARAWQLPRLAAPAGRHVWFSLRWIKKAHPPRGGRRAGYQRVALNRVLRCPTVRVPPQLLQRLPALDPLRHMDALEALAGQTDPLLLVPGPGRYRQLRIRQKNGKIRQLDAPDDGLKELQRRVAQHLLATVPFPAEVTGFLPHRSVVTHARRHAGARQAVVVDIADFFPSVHYQQVVDGLASADRAGGRDPKVDTLLPLCFVYRNGKARLPQGGPASPILANLAARATDAQVVTEALAAFGAGGFQYARYADDLVLSTTRTPQEDPGFVSRARRILEAAITCRGWRVATEKTRVWRADPRATDPSLTLCGVLVPLDETGALTLPRPWRRTLRALLHAVRCGATGPGDAETRGSLSWAFAVTGHAGYLAGTGRVTRIGRAVTVPERFDDAFAAGWLEGSRTDPVDE